MNVDSYETTNAYHEIESRILSISDAFALLGMVKCENGFADRDLPFCLFHSLPNEPFFDFDISTA